MDKFAGRLFVDNINECFNIIQIKDDKNSNIDEPLSLIDTEFKTYSDFFNKVSFINYYQYNSNQILELLKKDNDKFKLYEKTDSKDLFLKLFILNYHDGGFIINKPFYINFNYFEIDINNLNNILSDDEYNLVYCSNKNLIDFSNIKDNIYHINSYSTSTQNKFLKYNNYDYLNENFYIFKFLYIKKNNDAIIDDIPYKFFIKSERNCGSNYLEKLINYYFECNYVESNCFFKNTYNWKHSMLNNNDIELLNKNNINTIFIKKYIVLDNIYI